jgi:hypothetical protein
MVICRMHSFAEDEREKRRPKTATGMKTMTPIRVARLTSKAAPIAAPQGLLVTRLGSMTAFPCDLKDVSGIILFLA